MKKLLIISAISTLALTSCLKDKPNVDFSGLKPFIELPYSGKAYFSSDAVTDTGQVDKKTGDRIITESFSVNIASTYPPSTATTVSVGVDASFITSYDAYDPSVNYIIMPPGSYKFNDTTVTIPGGQRLAYFSVTLDKTQLDPSKSYMLPIAIKASNLSISGNFNVHYYHFIGNDFAGVYNHYNTRWKVPDTTGGALSPNLNYYHQPSGTMVLAPLSPTEFIMNTFYYTAPDYDVTFTKTGSGANATYSNFQVTWWSQTPESTYFNPTVTIVQEPALDSYSFDPTTHLPIPYSSTTQYTFAQAQRLFRIYYKTLTRSVIDEYYKF